MSRGLLHGLAERALGVAQPLRSQLVAPATGVAGDEPAAGLTPDGPAAAALAPLVPSRTSGVRAAGQPPQPPLPRAKSDSAVAETRPRAVAPPMAGEGIVQAVPAGPVVPRVPVARAVAAVIGRHAVQHEPDTRAVAAQPAREPFIAAAASQPPAPSARSLVQEPPPLLPAQPAAWPSHAAPMIRAATGARFEARAAVPVAERPTEVHVSIGRVELTALAPSTNGARPAPRARDSGRSLADYLRPSAKGSP